ncbi:MAG: pilus assembly protein PilM, partial [Candidatus Omnitrophica bacterium]|nr:pilus assembly protein PilM [Candidatus Omnitrophota bacterium]
AENLGIDFKSAEQLKLKADNARLNEVLVALEQALSNLANEVRTSFDYYESQNASSVAKIFLSGGGSLVPGIKEKLANLLGIELEYWEPLEAISISDSVDFKKIKALSGQFAVAVGLALRK